MTKFAGGVEFSAIYLKVNCGHGNAQRTSLDACVNELVALMDADDICVSDRFEQQLKIHIAAGIDIVGGYIDWYCNEDYYLWLRMAQANCSMKNTGTILCNVRVGKEMYSRRGGWKYFQSEAKLQSYMREHKFISWGTYLANVGKRFIVQVLLPNRLRGWVFKNFAREKV